MQSFYCSFSEKLLGHLLVGNIGHVEVSSFLNVEAQAIKEGISLCSHLDHDLIIIESNAKLLVQSIHNSTLCPS